MNTEPIDFVMTEETLTDLWALALKQEIGITFEVNPKDTEWTKQKLYQIRRDLAIPEYNTINLHINADQKTIMMYKQAAKDALP